MSLKHLRKLPFRAAGAWAVSALVASTLSAAPINYGNFAGNTIQFLNVTEDSGTDATPLYGAPVVAGDGLAFTPNSSFSATSTNGSAPDITDGKLTTTLMTIAPNTFIKKIAIEEFGDYTLIGAGTAATTASVGAPVFLTVTELGGVAVTPIVLPTFNLAMAPSGGSYDLLSDAGIGVPWTGALMVDVEAELTSLGYMNPKPTKIEFRMDNTLTAASEAGTIAFIAKKGINAPLGTSIEVIVPEPSSFALIGVAVAGLVGMAIRRR